MIPNVVRNQKKLKLNEIFEDTFDEGFWQKKLRKNFGFCNYYQSIKFYISVDLSYYADYY